VFSFFREFCNSDKKDVLKKNSVGLEEVPLKSIITIALSITFVKEWKKVACPLFPWYNSKKSL